MSSSEKEKSIINYSFLNIESGIVNRLHIDLILSVRHRVGLPLRGQSTKNNARTRKGKKKTVANKKKATK